MANSSEAVEVTREYVASGKMFEDIRDLLPLLGTAHRLSGLIKVVEWRFVPASAFAVEED